VSNKYLAYTNQRVLNFFPMHCKYCDKDKSNSDFRKHSRKCKQCQDDYTRRWRAEHPEHYRRTRLAWLKKNKDQQKQYHRERYFGGRYKRAKNHIQNQKEWVNRNREKRNAAAAVQRAVKAGLISKPTHCEMCSLPAYLVGHHEDYSKRLEVKWICQSCHRYIHGLHKAREASIITKL
jgi:hypothetical protein